MQLEPLLPESEGLRAKSHILFDSDNSDDENEADSLDH